MFAKSVSKYEFHFTQKVGCELPAENYQFGTDFVLRVVS